MKSLLEIKFKSSINNSKSLEFDSSEQAEVEPDDNEIEILVKKVKYHGMMWPFHPYQIITWILAIFEILYLFLEVFPMMQNTAGFVVALIIYMLLLIPLIFFDIKLWFSDPTDPIIYQERQLVQESIQKRKLENRESVNYESNSKYMVIDTRDYDSKHLYVWDICLTHVQDKTKHCRECNRWVSNFDHHCKWLNNWIGSLNYKPFMWLITIYFLTNMYLFWAFVTHLTNVIKYSNEEYDVVYSSVISEDATTAKLVIAWI